MKAGQAAAIIRKAIKKTGHNPKNKVWVSNGVVNVDIHRWLDENDLWDVEDAINDLPDGEYDLDIN
tara:strand:- start:868 stop:1065 length:198 start_codon:yes stop_codon:yes gene_type:complete